MDDGFIYFEMENNGEVKVWGGIVYLVEIQVSSEVGGWDLLDFSGEVRVWDVNLK